MKKNNRFVAYRLIIVLLFSFFFSANAYTHPFLWKASGEHEFYLFGTIHLPDPRVTILPKEVDQALVDSDAFYAELDLSEENTMLIKQSMWLPEKKTLYNFISDDLQKEVTAYLHAINPELNLEFFAKQKIWVLAITLTILEQQLKYPGHPALDAVLYNRADALGLITGGLEDVNEQLAVFEEMTTKQQLIFLEDTVEFMRGTVSNKSSFVEESINDYLSGDLEGLMSHLMSYMKDNEFYDRLLERLINERNVTMAIRMLELVSQNKDKKFFFAVGAGHFLGEQGINSILKEQGYSLQVVE